MRIGRVEIIVDYSWIVMFFVMLIITKSFFSQAYPDNTDLFYWMMGGISSVLIFLSVFVHELAHYFVATKYGIKTTSIRLHIFGGYQPVAQEPESGRQEFVIALAGWAANIVLGGFSLGIYSYFWLMQKVTPVAGIAACLLVANGLLAGLHMIPGFPLDGGRVLRAILWDRWNDIARATRVVSQIGNSLALFFIIFGILQFLLTQNLFSALFFFIGLFMKQSATGHYQTILQQHALGQVPVRQVMTEKVITVDWLIPVEELVQTYIYKHQCTHFPVFNQSELIGMVSLGGVKSVSRDLWTFKQVRDIMVPIEDVACVRPSDNASEVLKKMASENIELMPVMENGKLVGVVSRDDIINLFRIKTDLGTA
ncbi:MAG: site-2 protease family protein [Acidobacteria bacterium]|nr:site-2 protease family protein [Acidobacteriota bacterium]